MYQDEDVKPYEDALWDWFLPQAIIPDYYGGQNKKETREVREHLRVCGIDRKYSSLPELGRYNSFKGTFADDNTTAGIVTVLWKCQCDTDGSVGWYSHGDLVIEGEFPLSRIIYEVIQNGLGKPSEEARD